MKTLECSTKGCHLGKKFSAFHAQVSFYDNKQSIEMHYQLAKRFIIDGEIKGVKDWREAKGKKAIGFEVKGILLPAEMLDQFYTALWLKYYGENPQLIEQAKQYDDFHDMFKGKSINCQADVLRDYIQLGRKAMVHRVSPFLTVLKNGGLVTVRTGELQQAKEHILVHQVNMQGVMGAGVAKDIKEAFPQTFEAYKKKCKEGTKLGDVQLVSEKGKVIANIFGQQYYGRDKKYTDEGALAAGLMRVKEYAQEIGGSVAIVYGIGCNLAGGDWNTVKMYIDNIFWDYPVVLIKKA